MYYGCDNVGEKEFTIPTNCLREIKHDLTFVGARREITAMYFKTPTAELLKRMKHMGLSLTENKEKLGRFVVCRVQ